MTAGAPPKLLKIYMEKKKQKICKNKSFAAVLTVIPVKGFVSVCVPQRQSSHQDRKSLASLFSLFFCIGVCRQPAHMILGEILGSADGASQNETFLRFCI